MSVTVKALQDVLNSTESIDHKRLYCEHVQKVWGEAETEEGFIKAMKTMFDRMVRQNCILLDNMTQSYFITFGAERE